MNAELSPLAGAQPIELDDVANWRLSRDNDQLIALALDCANTGTNTLSSTVLEELGTVLDYLAADRPRGLILYSPKASGFAAGADIREFDDMQDPDATTRRIGEVHDLFERLEQLPFPTVARVHGFCLGGGLEIALACRHIVASDDSATRLGFPEVMLGIHPGFGGVARSIRYCGALAALDLMMTGRSVNAKKARSLGLIDRAVPARHLQAAARHFAASWHPRRAPGRLKTAASNPLLRPVVSRIVARKLAANAREQHYPAPYAVLRMWRKHGANEAPLHRAEARSVGQLLTTTTSRNLVRLFKQQERLKTLGRAAGETPRHVHVIGAGTMGGDIAAWCALRGMQVTLQDRAPEFIAPAIERASRLFRRRVRDKYERAAATDRLIADFNGDGIARADVIVEAIVEDTEAKRSLFRELEQRARPDTLLATNTSSIPLNEIASALDSPQRLVGVHFFNPVAQMQLVEIITDPDTDAKAAAAASGFVTAIDRLPLPAASAPGFLINRVLSPYLQEAMLMFENGIPLTAIDEAAVSFGMPMGPLELADTVGLDICAHVGGILSKAFGGEAPSVLDRLVRGGRLGRKSNGGFYEYKKGKPVRRRAGECALSSNEIRDRMLLRMLNEAVACLREGIVEDADLIDLGMVFGTGFAPFRGGPLHYARDRGIEDCVAKLNALEAAHGERFRADDGWSALAGS